MGRKQKAINLNDIRITDDLFGSYIDKITSKILKHQWDILNDADGYEPTYCIYNFKIAAGRMIGKRKGVVFQDTDLYKWIEAAAFAIAGDMGDELIPMCEYAIDLIADAQEDDGYLNTYFTVNAPDKKWTNLVEGHELYTSGHMMEAAVAYTYATGNDKFLNIAKKNADLICKVFGNGDDRINGYPGHQEVEIGLIKLYHITGHKRYLDEAKYFLDERGKKPNYLEEEIKKRNGVPEFFPEFKNYDLEYSQAHIEPVKQKEAVGHAVRDMYMCSAMADIAAELEDIEYEKACKAIWNNMTKRRMYITGGIGSSGFRERFTTDFDLPNATNYSETCASIGLMMFGQRMTNLTGDASFYDEVERALYNTVLAGINIEGDRYFYVNPLEVVPNFCTAHTYMDHVKPIRQKWFNVACCPPNVVRTLCSLGQYIYAKSDDAIYINEFISSNMETKINNTKIKLSMDSKLLTSGKVNLEIETSNDFRLGIRIPWYVEDTEIYNGKNKINFESKNSYANIYLKKGLHDINIFFSIKPRWYAANNDVRADAGKMALMKGPIVYCLEEIDNGSHLSEIYVDADTELVEEKAMDNLAGNIPVISYDAYRIKNDKINEDELYGSVGTKKENVHLKAIAYSQWENRGEGEMMVWQKSFFK